MLVEIKEPLYSEIKEFVNRLKAEGKGPRTIREFVNVFVEIGLEKMSELEDLEAAKREIEERHTKLSVSGTFGSRE